MSLKESNTLNFDKVDFFAYEMILKNDTEKYIKNFDESAPRIVDKEAINFRSSYRGRDQTYEMIEWDLNEGIEECWNRINEFDVLFQLGHKSDSEKAKQYVKKFRLFLIKIPHLPYDFIIINAILDEKKIAEVTIPNDLLNILSSINDYCDRFPGIINSNGATGKYRPCYVKFQYNDRDLEIKNNIEQIKILEQNKNLHERIKYENYFAASEKFRSIHFDLDGLSSDVTTVSHKGSYFSIMGFLSSIKMGTPLELSNFEIIFSSKNPVNNFWTHHTSFLGNFDTHFSTHLIFESVLLFLLYLLRKTDQFNIQLKEILKEFRLNKNKKSFSNTEFYDKLTHFDEELLFIADEIDTVSFFINGSLARTISNIQTFPLMIQKKGDYKLRTKNGFLKEIYELSKNQIPIIRSKMDSLNEQTSVIKNNFHDRIMLENTMSMNKYSKKNWFVSVSLVTLSIIVASKIIYDVWNDMKLEQITVEWQLVIIGVSLLVFGIIGYYRYKKINSEKSLNNYL